MHDLYASASLVAIYVMVVVCPCLPRRPHLSSWLRCRWQASCCQSFFLSMISFKRLLSRGRWHAAFPPSCFSPHSYWLSVFASFCVPRFSRKSRLWLRHVSFIARFMCCCTVVRPRFSGTFLAFFLAVRFADLDLRECLRLDMFSQSTALVSKFDLGFVRIHFTKLLRFWGKAGKNLGQNLSVFVVYPWAIASDHCRSNRSARKFPKNHGWSLGWRRWILLISQQCFARSILRDGGFTLLVTVMCVSRISALAQISCKSPYSLLGLV